MPQTNHYQTLNISPQATSREIKQAYRRLAKLFHPDSNSDTTNTDKIIQINAAYEILGDRDRRRTYDRQLQEAQYPSPFPNQEKRQAEAQRQYQHHQKTTHNTDVQLEVWLQEVYKPLNRLINPILKELDSQIEQLSADPFDDELMAEFQAYLEECRQYLEKAQVVFHSQPNPAHVAGAAASLYYCLNQLGDGIEELERFTLNYDDYYLHIGQELFRISSRLHGEARNALKDISY